MGTRAARRAALHAAVALAALLVALGPAWGATGRGPGATRLVNTRMTLRGSDLPLGSVLSQVARSAQLALVVDRDVRLDRIVASPNLEDQSLDTALTVVLTPLGYSWEVDEPHGHLRIFVYETRTFKIAMPVVVQNWSAAIANTGGVEGAASTDPSGGMGARIGLASRSDTTGIWAEVETSLVRMLGDPAAPVSPAEKDKERPRDMGAFSVNRVAGFVTVRALPTVMHTVAAYFDALNEEMGRSVAIEARVIQVDINDSTSAGIDWSLLTARLGDMVFLSGGSAKSVLVGEGIPFLRVSGRGGDAFIRAMEEQGKVTVVAQPTLALGNNLPAIIELAQVQAYVSQQKTTTVQGGVAETTVQTSSLSDGLIISMLPRVLDTGEVSLALAAILQDVLEVKRENFGDGFVELPKTARRSYNGVVRAKLNETLIIGGLLSTRKERTHTGIPFLSRIPVVGWLFGGLHNIDKRSELIIAVTPREIQGLPALAPQAMENATLSGEAK